MYSIMMDSLRAQEPDSWSDRPKQAQASREAGKQTKQLLLLLLILLLSLS